jgi:TolB-like protein
LRCAWLVLFLLIGTRVEAGALPRLVVTGLSAGDPALTALATAAEEQLVGELGRLGRFEVIGRTEMTTLLGIERQRQLLGCSEDSSACLAELSGALGAQWVVSGQLSRVGGELRLHLKLLDQRRSKVVARESVTAAGDRELLALLAGTADRLAGAASPTRTPTTAIVLMAGGAMAAAAGGVLMGLQADGIASLQRSISASRITAIEATTRRDELFKERYAGAGLLIAGLALVATGVVWSIFWREPIVVVAPAEGGGALLVGGRW